MTLPDIVKQPITFGELKNSLRKIKEKKEGLVVADVVAKHISIISNYLKKVEGIKEPSIDDVLKYLDGAPDDLTLFSYDNVVGRPCYETATCIGYKWLYGLVVKPISDHNLPVLDLQKEKAVRRELMLALEKTTPYIKWLGHGNASIITGQSGDYITWVGDYDGGLKMRNANVMVFSALSCITAKSLGPWLVKNKYVDSYYGYEDTFIFAGGSESLERPFFDSDTTFDRSLLEKHTTGESFDLAQERWDYWLKSEIIPSYIKAWILHDKECAKLVGATDINPFEGQPPAPPEPEPPEPEPSKFTFSFTYDGELDANGVGYVYLWRWKLPIQLKIKGTVKGKGEGKGQEESNK